MGGLVAAAGRSRKRSFRRELFTGIYRANSWVLFAAIVSIYLFFTWFLNAEVLTDQVYFYSLGNRVGTEKMSAFLDAGHSISWLGYALIPLVLILKIGLVSLCLIAGLLFTSEKLSFRLVCRIVLFAESAFVASCLLKLVMLCFFHRVDTLEQYVNFAPLSLFSLVGPSVPYWLSYPLQTIDLFQLTYIGLLSAGLAGYCRKPFKKMLWLVLASYGLGLLCSMIGFAFLTFSNA